MNNQSEPKSRLLRIAAVAGIIVVALSVGLLAALGQQIGSVFSNVSSNFSVEMGSAQQAPADQAAAGRTTSGAADSVDDGAVAESEADAAVSQPQPAQQSTAAAFAMPTQPAAGAVSGAPVTGDAAQTNALPPSSGEVAVAITATPLGTAAAGVQSQPPNQPAEPPAPGDMFFQPINENPFMDTQDDNLSTFAMDVDTASYTVGRNYLLGYSQLPPADSVRTEEYVNYFDADYASPTGDDAFSITLTAAPAPFGFDGHYLLRVGVQGRYIAPQDRAPMLLIFVIDVSGSMDMENRLGLVKESLAILLTELREDDRVGIAVYSDNSRVILEPTPASERETIQTAIDSLRPEGSTNAEAGLRLGYGMATANRRDDQPTRVILLSDGVANVGLTDPNGILATIQSAVDQDINLSTIGFGMGNYNDVLMEQLANDGDGNYYYVDNLREARRVFVHNLSSTLQVIAYDAKIQVDFNPAVTDRYRLMGYENRAVADSDFRVDTVDAGEVGAGHSVTALYEIALEGTPGTAQTVSNDVIATVYVRYEDAETREVVEINREIRISDLISDFNEAPPSFRLLAGVAEFAELLRGSYWASDGSFSAVQDIVNPLASVYADDPTVMEFVGMVERAAQLSGE